MPNVFAYNDYRQFLKDFVETAKKERERFSYRSFNREVGFTSPNFLRMVILGQRNLSHKAILKLIHYFDFNKKQAHFFENLVYFNQSDSYEEKIKFYETLSFIKAYQDIKKLDFQSYQYFSKWYIPTIREMTMMDNFKENAAWIAEYLSHSITEAEAKEALKILLDLKLIAYDKNNKLKPVDQNLTTDDEVSHISLLHFHKDMIKLADESLKTTPKKFRDISSLTVALNYKSFLKVKQRLQEIRHELNLELSKTKKTNAVYQLNLQFFNLTKIPPRWEKK